GTLEGEQLRIRPCPFLTERHCCCRATFCVPARCSFRLVEGFLEVFKLPGHVRPPRECAVAPRPMERPWRCPLQLGRVARAFRQTMPPPRQRQLRLRDFGFSSP